MNSTTLRGIFPEPKPVHRRNFVRENIKQLKDMQSFIQDNKIESKSQELKTNKFKHVAPKVYSYMTTRRNLSKDTLGKRPASNNQILKGFKPGMHAFNRHKFGEHKSIHRGVQTERPEDVPKLYESGHLKAPSPSLLAQTKQSPKKARDRGDAPSQNLTKSLQKLDLEDKQNYIKTNMKNLKTNKQKLEETPDPNLAPPKYQKGALPKYLKDKKDDEKPVEFEGQMASGLIQLPDDERREYLRVARENYASLIKELNSMPMSNDTLKKRKRKMEIEDELKHLDEVIKVFQKPKVFVKADA